MSEVQETFPVDPENDDPQEQSFALGSMQEQAHSQLEHHQQDPSQQEPSQYQQPSVAEEEEALEPEAEPININREQLIERL